MTKKQHLNKTLTILYCISTLLSNAQSKVWVADNGNGTYKNPVIHADYSDPDAIRVGDDYYMVSSSFNHIPGIPLLHSKDLVNWKLIGHILQKQLPIDHFSKVQHGNGVWAPSIRYHNNQFIIFYPDPDFGIYMIKAKNILGPWTDPVLVEAGKGLIDPCPLWDTDNKVYLVHAFAGSRAGIKSVIVVKELNQDLTKVISDGVIVYDGHAFDPTIEGPKFYKRNGYYYIFAPAGGVATGWQTVLRSRSVYGPYERRVVMDEGSTAINGPHQGAWIQTKTGEDWFLHFQDKEAYGRVVHLQPMKWLDDWPVIGEDKDDDWIGQPVLVYKKPNVSKTYPISTIVDSDEFTEHRLGLQWQWQANSKFYWKYLSSGRLYLYSVQSPDSSKNLWNCPNLLMQKFPAEEFTATTYFTFDPRNEGEKAGLIVFGSDYAKLAIKKTSDGNQIEWSVCKDADKGKEETTITLLNTNSIAFFFRVQVKKGGVCQFSYSQNGRDFLAAGDPFIAKPGKWVGSKVGLFCTREKKSNDSGAASFDWFRVE